MYLFSLAMTGVELRPQALPRFGDGSRGDRDDVFKADSSTDVSCTDARLNAKFRHFARQYIIDQLRKHDFNALADKYDTCKKCDDSSEKMLHHLAGNLAEERKRQFEDILIRLKLTDANLSETYRAIVKEMLIDGVNWGRILAFLVFSGALAVHCAQQGMEQRVGDVITWTESDVEKTVSRWVDRQGGWEAFVDHFDDGSWTIEPPRYLLASVIAGVIVGGLYLLKKLF